MDTGFVVRQVRQNLEEEKGGISRPSTLEGGRQNLEEEKGSVAELRLWL
jgi:hypothetical protein